MILFSPGPSNISERVRRAMLAPDIGHREPEAAALIGELVEGLRAVSGLSASAPHQITLLGGSGSVAIESMIAAARPLGRVLVIANGPYGERAAAMGRHHGVDIDEWRLLWGAEIDLGLLEQKLTAQSFGAVYLVHHETATGCLNPLREVAAIAKRHGALVLADTISSIVGEPIEIEGWQLDGVIGSSNKCLRGVPGAAFVIASPALMAAAEAQRGMHYANLATHAALQQKGAFPFTPPLAAMFALREAIAETLDEGVPARQAHYVALMSRLVAGLEQLGLRSMLPAAQRGHTLIACPLPVGWSYDAFHAPLKARGFCIYAAQGALEGQAFRLGIIGHFGRDAVDGLLDAMREVLGT